MVCIVESTSQLNSVHYDLAHGSYAHRYASFFQSFFHKEIQRCEIKRMIKPIRANDLNNLNCDTEHTAEK